MNENVTLILILHNRHANLDRLLDFYLAEDFNIIIADSSTVPHHFHQPLKNAISYRYMPGVTYTQKIEAILKDVHTDYVALCADDDFIIPAGLKECVNFLNSHMDYATAQGKILKFHKEYSAGLIRIGIQYVGNYSLEDEEAAVRLKKLFHPYKSLLYAVHRTQILKQSLHTAGEHIKNLYLNEYVMSVLPILYGKSKDLDSLYQVREFASDSDDKITDNLDNILFDGQYAEELGNFITLLHQNAPDSFKTQSVSRALIFQVLSEYAQIIRGFKSKRKTITKSILERTLLLTEKGRKLIWNRRYKRDLAKVTSTISQKELETLKSIAVLLQKYSLK